MNWRSEYKKCLLDTSRQYMIETYVLNSKIWPGHETILQRLNKKQQYTIVNKSRGVGFTTLLASYIACELVLNSDENKQYLYITPHHVMCREFLNQVKEIVKKIPDGFFTGQNIVPRMENNSTFRVGKAVIKFMSINMHTQYMLPDNQKEQYELIFIDEPVAGSSQFVNTYDIRSMLYTLSLACNHIIIGGTPNHKNEHWFETIRQAINDNAYIILPWYTSYKNRENGDDTPIILHNENIETHTNKWFEKMKQNFWNKEDFEEEIECKVWRNITIKEYI